MPSIPYAQPSTRRRLPGDERFKMLLVALATSSAGDWIYNVTLLAFVAQRGGVGWMGVVTAARIMPIVLLGPLGGLLADRHNRRRLMLGADLLRATLMAGLAIVAVTSLPLWLAPVLAALATAASAAHPSCVSTTTVRLVAPDELNAANAIRAGVGQAGIVAGPAIGGLLLLVASPAIGFLVNAATFALSAAATAAIPQGRAFEPVPRDRTVPTRVVADLRAGVAALRGEPIARKLIAADMVCSGVYGSLTVLLSSIAARVGDADGGYGIILAALGLGGLIGAFLAGRSSANWRRTLAVGLIAVALPLPLFGIIDSLAAALALALVAGGGGVVAEIMGETMLARTLPEEMLGRVFGIAIPASLSGIVLGALLAGPLETAFGLAGALGVISATVIAVLAIVVSPAAAPGTIARTPAFR
jgi:predicted MFS family arabinose efflux permease